MKIFLLPLLLITIFTGFSQTSKNQNIYAGLDYKLGSFSGAGVDINYSYKQKYTSQLQFTSNIRPSTQLPDNYDPGNDILGKNENPVEKLITWSLLVGRVYNLNESASLRVNLQMGAAYNTFRIPVNFTPNDDSCSLVVCPSNYDHTIRKVNNIGFILKPSLEIPFNHSFGMSISPVVNLNNEEIMYSGQIGIIFGVLKSK